MPARRGAANRNLRLIWRISLLPLRGVSVHPLYTVQANSGRRLLPLLHSLGRPAGIGLLCSQELVGNLIRAEKNRPSGAKARVGFARSTARLKSCPDTRLEFFNRFLGSSRRHNSCCAWKRSSKSELLRCHAYLFRIS